MITRYSDQLLNPSSGNWGISNILWVKPILTNIFLDLSVVYPLALLYAWVKLVYAENRARLMKDLRKER